MTGARDIDFGRLENSVSCRPFGIRPEIVRVAYPVEETMRGIRESAIPDFCANFLAERKTSEEHRSGGQSAILSVTV
jgi:hypothetical protein